RSYREFQDRSLLGKRSGTTNAANVENTFAVNERRRSAWAVLDIDRRIDAKLVWCRGGRVDPGLEAVIVRSRAPRIGAERTEEAVAAGVVVQLGAPRRVWTAAATLHGNCVLLARFRVNSGRRDIDAYIRRRIGERVDHRYVVDVDRCPVKDAAVIVCWQSTHD